MAMLFVVVPLLLVALATWHDLRTREVPDWISYTLGLWSLVCIACGLGNNSWGGVFLGGLLAFAITFPFCWLGGLGGADVRLMVGLGMIFGPSVLLLLAILTALLGGVLAIVAVLRGQKDYAYCPAILGALVLVLTLSMVLHGRLA